MPENLSASSSSDSDDGDSSQKSSTDHGSSVEHGEEHDDENFGTLNKIKK